MMIPLPLHLPYNFRDGSNSTWAGYEKAWARMKRLNETVQVLFPTIITSCFDGMCSHDVTSRIST